jgi:aminoglycoside phosphotransferase family enzyme
MMDVLLSKDCVSQEMVERLAAKLAGFHQRAQTNAEIASYGSLNAILANTEENFGQTLAYLGVSLSPEQYRNTRAYTDGFAVQNRELFEERKRAGKIRDCHGDLHTAHVCFVDGISIFDCIEFNDRFRYCDVASEIAFLAMDLDYHHHPHLSSEFVDAYVSAAQDKELPRLVNFYKCYRAYVRGKVGSFKLADPLVPQEEKPGILAAARRYFELAHLYAGI